MRQRRVYRSSWKNGATEGRGSVSQKQETSCVQRSSKLAVLPKYPHRVISTLNPKGELGNFPFPLQPAEKFNTYFNLPFVLLGIHSLCDQGPPKIHTPAGDSSIVSSFPKGESHSPILGLDDEKCCECSVQMFFSLSGIRDSSSPSYPPGECYLLLPALGKIQMIKTLDS